MTYPSLYRAMRALIIDSLKIIRDKFEDPPKWPDAQFREVSFPRSGGAQWGIVTRPYPTQALSAAWIEIASLPSFEAVKSELKKLEEEGKAVGHWSGDLASAYAFPVLEKYICAGLPLTFQEEGFARFYEEIESYVSSSTATVLCFLELCGLKSDLPIVQLDRDHRILKIDEATARRLWIRLHHTTFPISHSMYSLLEPVGTRHPLMPDQVVLEVTFRYPKKRSGEMGVLLGSQIKRASTALRLSHPGSGFIRFHEYDYVGFFPESGFFGFREELNPHTFSFAIDDTVATRLQKRWPDSLLIADRLERAPAEVPTPLRVAVERLDSSIDKKVPADQLLDYMIALEALCSSERDAVSYRVALRVATLIGKDAGGRQAVFDLLKEAYDERSNLSHGRPSKLSSSDAASVRKFLLQIEEVLARTIHFFIQAEIKKRKKEEVLKMIDTAITTQDRTMLESSLTSKY